MPKYKALKGMQLQGFAAWEAQQKTIDSVMLSIYRDAYKEALHQVSSLYTEVGLTTPVDGKFILQSDAIKYNLLQSKISTILSEIKSLEAKGTRIAQHSALQAIQDGYYRNAWAFEQAVQAKLSFPVLTLSVARDKIGAEIGGHTIPDMIARNVAAQSYAVEGAIKKSIAAGDSFTAASRILKAEFDKALGASLLTMNASSGRLYSEGTQSAHDAAVESGVPLQKQWAATLDDKTRPEHAALDGTFADDEGLFWINGESAPQPREFDDPAQSINCRCVVYDVIDEGGIRAANPEDVLPPRSFKDWAEPLGWTAENGWPS
jgi:hypothetical protein